MKTSVNGEPAEWPPAVIERWELLTKAEGKITSANWYTARPWQDQYSTGSTTEGFVYTAKVGSAYRVYDATWQVEKPGAAYIEPRAEL